MQADIHMLWSALPYLRDYSNQRVCVHRVCMVLSEPALNVLA